MPVKSRTFNFASLLATVSLAATLCGSTADAAPHHGHATTPANTAVAHHAIQPVRTGSILFNEPGKLILQPGNRYPEFKFIRAKKGWPHTIRLLPCLALQAMIAIEKSHTDFVISGMLTQYHHQFYLLPDADVRLFHRHPHGTTASAPAATTTPATATTGQNTSAQAVLNNLLSHHISRPIQQLIRIKPMLTAKPIPDLPQPVGYVQPPALREGSYIWNRPGRLLFNQPLREWIFVFQADSSSLLEPPLILLPCRLLQRMETLSARRGTEIKFRVSGKITQFNGRNYLFTTYVEVAHNLGRF